MKSTRVLFAGDVCGKLGLCMLQQTLPNIIQSENVDLVVVNGENVVAGSGVDPKTSPLFFSAGCHVITGGNHTLEKFNLRDSFGEQPNVLRPANIPFVRGSGVAKLEINNVKYLVINLMGRENMRAIDCPFQTADAILEDLSYDIDFKDSVVFVDFHAESTEEKEAMGFYLDGRVSFIAGSHTHTQTADEKILPNGTAYITDAGMVGSLNAIIGGAITPAVKKAITQVPQKYEWDESGDAVFSAVVVEIDLETKKALSIRRICIRDSF